MEVSQLVKIKREKKFILTLAKAEYCQEALMFSIRISAVEAAL